MHASDINGFACKEQVFIDLFEHPEKVSISTGHGNEEKIRLDVDINIYSWGDIIIKMTSPPFIVVSLPLHISHLCFINLLESHLFIKVKFFWLTAFALVRIHKKLQKSYSKLYIEIFEITSLYWMHVLIDYSYRNRSRAAVAEWVRPNESDNNKKSIIICF